MELTIGAWYNEVGIYFDFSHRIEHFIRLTIKESIMSPLGLLELHPDKFLHLSVTTKVDQNKLEVKMGQLRKNSQSINCGLWFPYNKIINSSNPKNAYVEYYIQCLPEIFSKWNVNETQIEEAANKIRTEIFDNPKYDFTEDELIEKKKEKEFNDSALKDILKELNLD